MLLRPPTSRTALAVRQNFGYDPGMVGKLFLAFTVVTVVEIALLIQVGQLIGFWGTLAIVVGTGYLGARLVADQGRRVVERMRRDMQQMVVPADAILDGVLILISGAFLITPGVLTDVVGFLLLVPSVRAPIKRAGRRRFKGLVEAARVQVNVARAQQGARPQRVVDPSDVEVVDVEFVEVRNESDAPPEE